MAQEFLALNALIIALELYSYPSYLYWHNDQDVGMKIAIIPARGGSKRIPHKNTKQFCGKPIIAYSIEAALASGIFEHRLTQ